MVIRAAVGGLELSLTAGDAWLEVRYRLRGVVPAAGEVLAELPVTVAGIPASAVAEGELTAADDAGPVPLRSTVVDNGPTARPLVRQWSVTRSVVGEVEVRYGAPYRAVDQHTTPGHPPLDLRREGGGVTGAGVSFLALPPAARRWDLRLRWAGVCSLGVGEVAVAGTTDVLRDCHYMAGDLGHERAGGVTVWWLTRPTFDVRAFAERVARHHEITAGAFGGSAGELRVFLRSNPYPAMSASALPSSFVVGWDPGMPGAEAEMDYTLAHELVHGWVHLEGAEDEVVWFDEGAADYFATVLPYRHGLTSRETLLDRVNLAARLCYANPYRSLPLPEVMRLAWSDFRAQQLPYGRGLFYLADLDARLARSPGGGSVQQLVTRLRAGRQLTRAQWLDAVSAATGADEARSLEAMVFQPGGRPGDGVWGPEFELFLDDAPVVDPGFGPATFSTRRITGLTPGGPAAAAGLVEGDVVLDRPSFSELARLRPGEPFTVTVERDGRAHAVTVAGASQQVEVPAWRPRSR